MAVKILIQMAGAFFAVYGFGLVLNVPKKFVPCAGAAGAVGWAVYLAVDQAGGSFLVSNFFSAFVISLISHILARIFKAPVTLFIIAALMTLVPGAGMYRIAYSALQGDTSMTLFYVIQTLEIAGVIAVAVFLTDTIFRLRLLIKKGKN